MSTPIEAEKLEELEFKWGKKRGVGGKKKDVRFYESFTYDGMDYTLYDCVYMYKEGEPAPYIGKLVKIWENSDKSKKIKVHWFFRPSEISYYLRDAVLVENELFFASGDGTGIANINPLEAIAGKYNVLCISKDSRNPQPSAEELQMADYVFYRVFDVKSGMVSDQMDDTVGGLEVKYVFNSTESVRALDVHNLNSTGKDVRNVTACGETLKVACGETLEVAGKNSLQQLNNVKPDVNEGHVLGKEDTNADEVQVKKGSLRGACSSGVHANSSKIREIEGISVEKKSMLGDKTVECKDGSEKDKIKDIKLPVSQVKMEERVKSPRNTGELDDTQSKKAKHDGTVSSSGVANIVQSLTSPGNDTTNLVAGMLSSNGKPKSEFNNNLDWSGKDVKVPGKSETIVSSEGTPKSEHAEGSVGLGKDAKLTKDLNALQGKQSKGNGSVSREKLESAQAKDYFGIEKDKKLGENLSVCIERPSRINVASPNETPKSGSNKDFQGKLVNNPNASIERPLKRSADLYTEKSNTPLAKDSSHLGGPPTKKGKYDTFVKMSEGCKNNTFENTKDKICPDELKNSPTGEIKNSPTHATYDNITKSKLGKGTSTENFNDKVGKLSKTNLPTPLITCDGDYGKVGSRIFEVTRRPIVEKSNWMKLPWEDRMKTAHDQGRLVLFQNLDPECTSGEVEDIVWHAFKEECTAKMVQHTAISNPYSGQAFVVFKTREAVDRVVKKLDIGCLMLPIQRPLVVRIVDFPKFLEKQISFVGHLAIDKARRQIQRDMKEAVATSHYSQNNTIEYEMAMAWCLLQSKSDRWWKTLYEQQRKEIKKLSCDLKSK